MQFSSNIDFSLLNDICGTELPINNLESSENFASYIHSCATCSCMGC